MMARYLRSVLCTQELLQMKVASFEMELIKCKLPVEYISKEDIKKIVESYAKLKSENVICIENYRIHNASDKLLGFLADYLKLKVFVKVKNSDNIEESKVLQFFVKAVSRVNAAKALTVKDNNLFSKEVQFYNLIKKKIEIPGLNEWSPECYALLNDAIVFEDLNAKNYQVANKKDRFDLKHTKCALRALAKFHASSIAYTSLRSNQLNRKFNIEDDFSNILDRANFCNNDSWYIQCAKSSLIAIKTYSKYGKMPEVFNVIKKRWSSIWSTDEFDYPAEKFKAICHRDLWNNNIMFKYRDDFRSVPEEAVLVDYQAIRYQPAATDVMMLLYCNLDPKFREANMTYFLKYYFNEVDQLLKACNIPLSLESIISQGEFLLSAEKCRKWGLITCACLMPAVYLDDRIITDVFSDSERFNEILFKNKSEFVIKMMDELPDYKNLVLSIFEEIVERYCVSNPILLPNEALK